MNEMDLTALLAGNRSYRRFGTRQVTPGELTDMIAATRTVASAGNLQQLRFVPVFGTRACEKVYPCLGWAGYLPEWDGPVPAERPTGYIVVVCRPDVGGNFNLGIDLGICAQCILLTARTMGLGGCMLRNVKRDALTAALDLPDGAWEIALVIALGEPVEKVEIVPVRNGDIRYFRDAAGVHYVPKRETAELIFPTPLTERN